jgi:hypothetical protein
MSYTNEDWSFAELKRSETLWGPHGYHTYPAKFIPHLVRRIIDEFVVPGQIVGDVFLGSGTTGVEAIRANCQFYGSDINPVAILISRAKCFPLEESHLTEAWSRALQEISTFPLVGRRALSQEDKDKILSININQASSEERWIYWFPETQRQLLSHILQVILQMPDRGHQTFMLCAFSNILKRCSIWLSGSTKAQKDLEKTLADPVTEFIRQVSDMIRRNSLYWRDLISNNVDPNQVEKRAHILEQDTRAITDDDIRLDLLVTSPPYATCYEYSDIYQLPQLWFEKFGVLQSPEKKERWIGSKNGSSAPSDDGTFSSIGAKSADTALASLLDVANHSASKGTSIRREARALHRYFLDMQLSVCEMARIVPRGKHMVLVIGDSRKIDVDIPTTQALVEMSQAAGFVLKKKIERKIPVRVLVSTRDRVSGRFSSTVNSDIEVYPEENILVFKRI